MYKPDYNKQKLLLERMVDMFKHCTASLEPTSQNSNAFETTNEIRGLKTFGTIVTYRLMSPPSLAFPLSN